MAEGRSCDETLATWPPNGAMLVLIHVSSIKTRLHQRDLITHGGFTHKTKHYNRQRRIAREAQAHYYFELIRDIAFDDEGDFFVENGKMVADHCRVQRARLEVDALKWASSKLLPNVYGDRPAEQPAGAITIRWKNGPSEPPPVAPQPKLIPYHRPRLPADLSDAARSLWMEVLELIRCEMPSDDTSLPEEIADVLIKALKAHFRKKRKPAKQPSFGDYAGD
jgi:hypothetical protein